MQTENLSHFMAIRKLMSQDHMSSKGIPLPCVVPSFLHEWNQYPGTYLAGNYLLGLLLGLSKSHHKITFYAVGSTDALRTEYASSCPPAVPVVKTYLSTIQEVVSRFNHSLSRLWLGKDNIIYATPSAHYCLTHKISITDNYDRMTRLYPTITWLPLDSQLFQQFYAKDNAFYVGLDVDNQHTDWTPVVFNQDRAIVTKQIGVYHVSCLLLNHERVTPFSFMKYLKKLSNQTALIRGIHHLNIYSVLDIVFVDVLPNAQPVVFYIR
jgi:hypothetical protein